MVTKGLKKKPVYLLISLFIEFSAIGCLLSRKAHDNLITMTGERRVPVLVVSYCHFSIDRAQYEGKSMFSTGACRGVR